MYIQKQHIWYALAVLVAGVIIAASIYNSRSAEVRDIDPCSATPGRLNC